MIKSTDWQQTLIQQMLKSGEFSEPKTVGTPKLPGHDEALGTFPVTYLSPTSDLGNQRAAILFSSIQLGSHVLDRKSYEGQNSATVMLICQEMVNTMDAFQVLTNF